MLIFSLFFSLISAFNPAFSGLFINFHFVLLAFLLLLLFDIFLTLLCFFFLSHNFSVDKFSSFFLFPFLLPLRAQNSRCLLSFFFFVFPLFQKRSRQQLLFLFFFSTFVTSVLQNSIIYSLRFLLLLLFCVCVCVFFLPHLPRCLCDHPATSHFFPLSLFSFLRSWQSTYPSVFVLFV